MLWFIQIQQSESWSIDRNLWSDILYDLSSEMAGIFLYCRITKWRNSGLHYGKSRGTIDFSVHGLNLQMFISRATMTESNGMVTWPPLLSSQTTDVLVSPENSWTYLKGFQKKRILGLSTCLFERKIQERADTWLLCHSISDWSTSVVMV